MNIHEKYISRCIELGKLGIGNTYPNPSVGSCIVYNNKIIGEGYTSRPGKNHAEINAINSVKIKSQLKESTLYVTLEPCHMCAKAIVDARIRNVYFATLEPKNGSIVSQDNFFDKKHLNHRVHFRFGMMREEASDLLKLFFQTKR